MAKGNPGSAGAGILLYRSSAASFEVFLVLPGGPYWRNRNVGAWQIPKGGIKEGEAPEKAALREFEEETGARPTGRLIPLPPIRQAGGKKVLAYAAQGQLDPSMIVSNRFEMVWPPRSGKVQSFPEIERAAWFDLDDARTHILVSQRPLLDRLAVLLAPNAHDGPRVALGTDPGSRPF